MNGIGTPFSRLARARSNSARERGRSVANRSRSRPSSSPTRSIAIVRTFTAPASGAPLSPQRRILPDRIPAFGADLLRPRVLELHAQAVGQPVRVGVVADDLICVDDVPVGETGLPALLEFRLL